MENHLSKILNQKNPSALRCLIGTWISLRNSIECGKKENLVLGDAWEGGEHQYILHSGQGKPYYYNPTAKWSKFTKKYGLKKIRFHKLRHTMVTLLIEAGAIQERVGHAYYRTTFDRYGHATKKLADETAELFNNFDPKKRYGQWILKPKNQVRQQFANNSLI
ncbi:tyrosine-type recombinase/integrase [Bacillus mojavensis]|uniref:tyrosine-type recombinase/integrase n=1 Tax=Bacillus mojavensis TaxID=72360 RepID=UPI00228119AB|nr:tyrosine-type recombinase/integrase [Bacillus mojavensis]MCY9190166.1 tyrosine-type recombinase/integrase [Bacillus mojavensis]